MLSAAGCADDQGAVSTASRDIEAKAPVAIGASLTADDFGDQVAAAHMLAQSGHVEGVLSLPGGQGLKVSGDVDAGESLEELQLAVQVEMGGKGSIELRLVEGAAYVKLPAMLAPPNAKPWVMVDLRDPNNPIGSMFEQLIASLDPSKFEELYDAVEKLENMGREDVNGIDTTHYQVTVDTAKIFEVMDLGKVSGVDLDDILKDMPTSLSSDVWVDDDALLVKTVSEFSGSKSEMYYSNWGEPISVRTPPAGQVGKLPF